MLKVDITKMRGAVELVFERGGSVLQGTIWTKVAKVITRYEIESTAPPDRVAAVLKAGRDGCFVRAALTTPVPMEDSVTLNGKPMPVP